MICLESFVEEKYPGFIQRRPLLGKTLVHILKLLCHESEFKQFSSDYPHLQGIDFVEQALNYFDFSFRIKNSHRERIPSQGRVVIIANHPIGSLDGLAVLKLVSEIRPDVKVVANEILSAIEPLDSLLLPVDNMAGRSGKEQLRSIKQHLENEGALIIFPAGEVSRMSAKGIRDGHWNPGFYRFAKQSNSPILPLLIDGRNSWFFYTLSLLAKPISTLWLIREMFKQANHNIDIYAGKVIEPESYKDLGLPPASIAKLFKKHVYRLAKKHTKSLSFAAEYEPLAHPENRWNLQKEITQCEKLGVTNDGKIIYLYRYVPNSSVMRELGRLRELTFRRVKEGTGKRRDIDPYDSYYDHVILWDCNELEIAGAYRMVRSREAMLNGTQTPRLYTQTLFDFNQSFNQYIENGLELGRSFVQPRYWGKRSVDYLWQGIGAYLNKYAEIRYLFGPVSISQDYSAAAQQAIVRFYSLYFGATSASGTVTPKTPYVLAEKQLDSPLFLQGNNYRIDFCHLKQYLKELGVTVPTLYKQYSELCEVGGAQFIDFNIDPDFADCIDGFLLVELKRIKQEKRLRYIEAHNPFEQSKNSAA